METIKEFFLTHATQNPSWIIGPLIVVISGLVTYYLNKRNMDSKQALNNCSECLKRIGETSFDGIDRNYNVLESKAKSLVSLIRRYQQIKDSVVIKKDKELLKQTENDSITHLEIAYKHPHNHKPTSSAFEKLQQHIKNQALIVNEDDQIRNEKLKKKPELEKLKQTIDEFLNV